jgi:2-oxoglutarate ferredoxin oxidoreductase subunit delta
VVENPKESGDGRARQQKEPDAMIVVDARFCKGCGVCIQFCPQHALKLTEEVNSRGFFTPYLVDVSECTECRQCEYLCPDFAIFLDEEPANDDA